jgi:hypothetical protein
MRLSVGQTVQLGHIESGQDGEVSFSVLVVDLNHTSNKELLLFGGTSFPIVRLTNGDGKALLPSPLLALRLFFSSGVEMCVVLHGREFLHRPRLANRKGAIGILPSLVELHPACISH